MVRRSQKRKIFVKLLTLLVLIIAGFVYKEDIEEGAKIVLDDVGLVQVQLGLNEQIPQDIAVTFCPSELCEDVFVDAFNKAEREIVCAFFEFDREELIGTLLERHEAGISVRVVIDGQYEDEEAFEEIISSDIVYVTDGTRSKFMHNKFCVIDEKIVLTGSANPTHNGFDFNDNNVVEIPSTFLAQNYKAEFEQLYSGTFGPKKESVLKYNELELKGPTQTYEVSSYFCPQDNCAKELVDVLSEAKEEILFANFVLTLDGAEEMLLQKVSEGVEVQGVIESRMFRTQGSRAGELNSSFTLVRDTNSKTMHHKVFVIDGKTIVTGSMNPSKSGTESNDENLLIIENEELGELYRAEVLALIG